MQRTDALSILRLNALPIPRHDHHVIQSPMPQLDRWENLALKTYQQPRQSLPSPVEADGVAA